MNQYNFGMGLTFDLEYKNVKFTFRAIEPSDFKALKSVMGVASLKDMKDLDLDLLSDSLTKFGEFLTSLYAGKDKGEMRFEKWRVGDLFDFVQYFSPFMYAQLMGPMFKVEIDKIQDSVEKKKNIP